MPFYGLSLVSDLWPFRDSGAMRVHSRTDNSFSIGLSVISIYMTLLLTLKRQGRVIFSSAALVILAPSR
jgi:hypothetical protein